MDLQTLTTVLSVYSKLDINLTYCNTSGNAGCLDYLVNNYKVKISTDDSEGGVMVWVDLLLFKNTQIYAVIDMSTNCVNQLWLHYKDCNINSEQEFIQVKNIVNKINRQLYPCDVQLNIYNENGWLTIYKSY